MAQGAMWALCLAVLRGECEQSRLETAAARLIEGLGAWNSLDSPAGDFLASLNSLLRGFHLHRGRPRVANANQTLLEKATAAP